MKKYERPNPMPVAVISVDSVNSIYVYEITHGIEDHVKYKWKDGVSDNPMRTARLRYNRSGDAFFISDGRRYYMNTAMKVF